MMSIRVFHVENYRSLRDVRAALQRVNVFTGLNGCGKSNLYRALQLLARAADGRLARTLAEEGGLGSALWAGEGRKRREPVRLRIAVQLDDWGYELSCGLPAPEDAQVQDPTYFSSDALVREEFVWSGPRRTPANTLCERSRAALIVRDATGRPAPYDAALDPSESMLAQLRDPGRFPELFALREQILQWRIYHHFDTGAHSPLRMPTVATRTPVLAEDGRDLVCALRTIHELGDARLLYETLGDAFPAAGWEFSRDTGGASPTSPSPRSSRSGNVACEATAQPRSIYSAGRIVLCYGRQGRPAAAGMRSAARSAAGTLGT